jgi:putative flippase GtrA
VTLTSIISDRHERSRFLRFAVVGAVGAVVDFGSYTILHNLLGITAVLASVLSFTAAIISNFTWNRLWTYPDSRSKPVSKQLVQFSVVSFVGLAIRTPMFALLVEPLNQLFSMLPSIPFLPDDFLGDKVALAIVVIVVMFWNFFANRYWTYSDVDRNLSSNEG